MYTLFGGILQLVGVQNFKLSGYMTVSKLCMHDFGARVSAPWKMFCFLLKFLLKKCYKDRFTYKIYNMTYFYVRGGGVSGPAPFR